ncbi:MAG: metallophosphoesterase [Planctomycetes bacterium]|nr:metallophosphoesterase [Planctomycetota bacterium]
MTPQSAFAGEWIWPQESLTILGDSHADAAVLAQSLDLTGDEDERVVLLGDLLDKGPSNLDLLDAVRQLLDTRPTTLLLGNHDLRFLLALEHLDAPREGPAAHFATRLGLKGLALARELHRAAGSPVPLASQAAARARLEPGPGWKKAFSEIEWANEVERSRELDRLDRKRAQLADALGGNFGWHHFAQALEIGREWFLDPDGRYAWLGSESRVCWRAGSFLFVHGGLDDLGARAILSEGDAWGADLARLRREAPLELYFGPIGRALRTKYRDFEPPLGEPGRRALTKLGVRALVTGHRPHPDAPRFVSRSEVLHLETHAGPGLPCATRILPGGILEFLAPGRTERAHVQDWGWSVV